MGYDWDFAVVLRDFDLLLLGLVNTLKVTGLALLFGVPLGLVLALCRLYGNALIRWPVGLVIEFLRTTPPIAQLFWFFFDLFKFSIFFFFFFSFCGEVILHSSVEVVESAEVEVAKTAL